MAFPSKTRGLRSIGVNGSVSRWRFSPSRPDELNSTIAIYGAAPGHQPLQVMLMLHKWSDPWLVFFFFPNKPAIIGPSFVRSAIEFALVKGWQPEESSPFVVQWKDEAFVVDKR